MAVESEVLAVAVLVLLLLPHPVVYERPALSPKYHYFLGAV